MDFEAIAQRLEALFGTRAAPSRFARAWGAIQEPANLRALALKALFEQLKEGAGDDRATRLHLLAARQELVENIAIIEGLAESREHPPFGYVTWLWRVTEALRKVASELARLPAGQKGHPPIRLPPLSEPALPLRTGPRLQGFAIEPLIELASREVNVLERRRRLLEAARRALLDSAAALSLPTGEVEPRLLSVTAAIQEVTEWQRAGVDPTEDVAHQLRRAVQDRDAAAVRSLLEIMDKMGHVSASDGALTRLRAARARVAAQVPVPAAPTLEQVSARVLGSAAAAAVLQASARAERAHEAPGATVTELVQAVNGVDASFELGRSVSPVRALEEQRRMAQVRFPTQTLVLEPARAVADLPNSLIGDPRLVVHGLATRSLLARRYLAERRSKRSVTTRCTEARYYLLDGSASMSGRRGRLRDAILISELSMLIQHLESGNAAARPVVYYRYFTRTAEEAVKVSRIEEALAAIEAIILRNSRGETDIQSALIDSFHQIDKERARDPNLQRAQIVLITDGIAKVDLWAVWRAREALGGMPVQVSVIALGSECPALKELAAIQRARGEPVFYHFLSPQAMAGILQRTRIAKPSVAPATSVEDDDAEATAAPPPSADEAEKGSASRDAEPLPLIDELELWHELDQLVDELSVLHHPPDADALDAAELLAQAYDELGVSFGEQGLEAERARAETARRDARAVTLRFERWFPDPDARQHHDASQAPDDDAPPAELLEVIEIVVCTVAELVDYLSGPPSSRRVDAIELLERLLLEAGVSPWAYTRALPHLPERGRDALCALRRGALG